MKKLNVGMIALRIYWIMAILCLLLELFPFPVNTWFENEPILASTYAVQELYSPIFFLIFLYVFSKHLIKIHKLRAEKRAIPRIYIVDCVLSLIHLIVLILFRYLHPGYSIF
ncbi:MAG: hypothetical protein Q4A78_04850 [Peptostreptococcaceae bacterium]|nr:hypothetical protein [Peptostreptococcaceae bacterium]